MATTIVNARVFDGENLRLWTSVRFEGGVITDCAERSAAMPGDEAVDAAGGTLLPGLIDAHIHLLPGALEQSLLFGVTTVLDMFSKPETVAAARDRAIRGGAADVRSSGIGATAPGGHPSLIYAPFPTVTGPEQAAGFVADRMVEGVDYLKMIAESGGSAAFTRPSLDAATITALTAAAHARGLKVVAHATSAAAVATVAAAGVDVIAHVPVREELADELVTRLAETGTVVCPTLATAENTLGERGDAAVANDPALGPHLGSAWVERLTRDRSRDRRGMPPYALVEHNVARLIAAGVCLLAGTDAPIPSTVYGASLHRELELLVRCGLTPAQALTAATASPARVFGLTDRGRIAIDQTADLVLVAGDPLTDIAVTRSITTIWRAGIACDRHAFPGSPAESEELAALEALDTQAAKVMAAIRHGRTGS
ncbi:MAG TPA: amidohydrolase family protein [Pseudonocardiaceae bacterium]